MSNPAPDAAAPPKDLPKAQRTMTITLSTKLCYREAKFPVGDPRRECHLALAQIDERVCGFCTWFQTADEKKIAAITWPTMLKAVAALKQVQATEAAEAHDAADHAPHAGDH